MTGFGLESVSVMKKITSDQVAQWAFVNSFVPFGIPIIIAVDAGGIFDRIFRRTFQ